MNPTPAFTKVKTIRQYEDGTADIDSFSVVKDKKLSSVKQEIGQTIETSKTTLAADVIGCLEPITSRQTSELVIHITTDKATGEPLFVTKQWIVNKEYYGR